MDAITIRQPWASLLAAGIKQYETRNWPPYQGMVGAPIAIHAGKSTAGLRDYSWQPPAAGLPMGWRDRTLLSLGARPGHEHEDLPFGAIIAVATLAYVIATDSPMADSISTEERALGDWQPGRFAWRLDNPRLLAEPIPCQGQQRIFHVEHPALEFIK